MLGGGVLVYFQMVKKQVSATQSLMFGLQENHVLLQEIETTVFSCL